MGTENTELEENKVYEFKIVPVLERYYDEDKAWGVYNFSTQDDNIPQYSDYFDPFSDNVQSQKMSSVVGKMQKLFIGSEYLMKCKLSYNNKFSSWQYDPVSIIALTPKDYNAQLLFLQSMTSESNAKNLLAEYPHVVEDVINGSLQEIDCSKIKGVGNYTWDKIKTGIIDNYVISDIIVMLQPLGVTYAMIKKLLSGEPNPSLLKQQLEENPYIMTKIRGLGFKRVDDLCLKLKPELRHSTYRLVAFVRYYLNEIGESEGHTWITTSTLNSIVSDNVPECQDLLDQLLLSNTFLYQEDDRIGLLRMRQVEERIFNILIEKTQFENSKFDFTEEEIQLGIKEAEKEQGFNYTDEQLNIINTSLRNNVAVISGKAGAGKSTISRAILKVYQNRNFSIAAMALSAKAAQRIIEATGLQATTIHRGLCAKGLTEFEYNHDNPLPYDVIYIDEASMINARLFYDLLSAIDINTRIMISGDCQQLPPIGYANIFSDILTRKDIFNSTELTKVMRQAEKSGILVDANMIRDGINPIISPELKVIHGELQDMYYMFRDNREALRNIAIKTFLSSVENDSLDEVIIAVPRKQDCLNSALEINKIIEEKLFGDVKQCVDRGFIKFHVGSKVRQTVNDYKKNVFNGETGYIIDICTVEERDKPKKDTLTTVVYKTPTGDNKVVTYSKNELDQLDLSYAMTVHALQGSGYKTVIGIVDNTHYSLLDTCMLYTLITRAKKRCLLLAEPKAFLMCIRNNKNISRQTWLKLINII